MRVRGVLQASATVSLLIGLWTGGPACAQTEGSLGLGGGLFVGGYFGELRHDWQAGLGGSLFLQRAWRLNFEGRVRGSMLWNDGSLEERVAGDDEADLGARPGEAPRSFRRTALELSLLYRLERYPLGEIGVPYIGAGFGTYERRVEFQDRSAGIRTVDAWDFGLHGIAGARLYRTSGLFLAIEGTLHAIDTPKEWTGAYDVSILLGVLIGP